MTSKCLLHVTKQKQNCIVYYNPALLDTCTYLPGDVRLQLKKKFEHWHKQDAKISSIIHTPLQTSSKCPLQVINQEQDCMHRVLNNPALLDSCTYLPGLAGLELRHQVVGGLVRGVRGPGVLAVGHVGARVAPAFRRATHAPCAAKLFSHVLTSIPTKCPP